MPNNNFYVNQGDSLLVDEVEALMLLKYFKNKNIEVDNDNIKQKILKLPESYVGYINLPYRKVIIMPRHTGVDLRHVIRMYYFVNGAGNLSLEDPIYDLDNSSEIIDISKIFIKELMHVIRQGLPSSYAEIHENTPYLKGKINIHPTNYNIKLKKKNVFNCTYDNLTLNNPINAQLSAALDKVSELQCGMEINFLKRHFVEIKRKLSIDFLKPVNIDKKTAYCRKAIDLAHLILNELFFSDIGDKSHGDGFLINYDRLFEDFIKIILVSHSNDSKFTFWSESRKYGKYLMSNKLYEKKYLPDLLYNFSDRIPYKTTAILDAKNKTSEPFKNQDVFQMLFYASILNSSKVILCYPSIIAKPIAMLQIDSDDLKLSTIYASFINITGESSIQFSRDIHMFISDIFSCID